MVYRPFRTIGRFVLAACAVSLGVASLGAQTAPSTTAPVWARTRRESTCSSATRTLAPTDS